MMTREILLNFEAIYTIVILLNRRLMTLVYRCVDFALNKLIHAHNFQWIAWWSNVYESTSSNVRIRYYAHNDNLTNSSYQLRRMRNSI